MRIRVKINGKEITGYWNGKFYKSKIDSEKNIRIYIDNKEYDIPKDGFKYEEVFTEKQLKYAKHLKEDFMRKLRKTIDESPLGWLEKDRDTVLEYFENQNSTYFLKNKSYLTDVLSIALSDCDILADIIRKNSKNTELNLKEIANKVL